MLKVGPKKVHLTGRAKSAIRRKGPAIGLTLSESANVEFRIVRKTAKTQVFNWKLGAGPGSVRIPSKIRKTMRRGSYRISAVATDSAQQISVIRTAAFRVIR